MGRKPNKPGAAVRLCVACGRLKPATAFQPGKRKCLTCQPLQRQRTDPAARRRQGRWTRARGRALRRLALEHPSQYRKACERRLRARPHELAPRQARKRAVAQGLSDLAKRHPTRYRELYQEELAWARTESQPIRQGRPPGARDRLALGSPAFTRTWRPPPRRRVPTAKPPTKGSRVRARQEAVRQRAAALFEQGQSASAVARRLGVARQTAVRWQASWRAGGAQALRSRGPSRRPKLPDDQLPAVDRALRQGPAAHGFATRVWTAEQVRVLIQRKTGVQLAPSVVKRLLRDRLGWSVQRP